MSAPQDVEVNSRGLAWMRTVAMAAVPAIALTIAVLYLFARGPLLLALGQLSGSSRTVGVLIGWSIWAVPLVASFTLASFLRDRTGMPRGRMMVLVTFIVCLWLPAIALLPGPSVEAQQQFSLLATSQAPLVAVSLLWGVHAGAGAAVLSFAALVLRRMGLVPQLSDAARLLGVIVVSVLALSGGLGFGRAAPPGLPIDQLWPTGRSFTFNGKYVRVLAASRTGGCSGMVLPTQAVTVLQHDGCGGSERGLFTDRRHDALVAVAVIAMPTTGLAHRAALALGHLSALTVPMIRAQDDSRRAVDNASRAVTEDVRDEVLVIDTSHADGRSPYIDTAPEQALGVAVANTLIGAIMGVV